MIVSRRGFLAGLLALPFAPKVAEATQGWFGHLVTAPELAVRAPCAYSAAAGLRWAYSAEFFSGTQWILSENGARGRNGEEVPHHLGRRSRWPSPARCS